MTFRWVFLFRFFATFENPNFDTDLDLLCIEFHDLLESLKFRIDLNKTDMETRTKIDIERIWFFLKSLFGYLLIFVTNFAMIRKEILSRKFQSAILTRIFRPQKIYNIWMFLSQMRQMFFTVFNKVSVFSTDDTNPSTFLIFQQNLTRIRNIQHIAFFQIASIFLVRKVNQQNSKRFPNQ